MTNASDNIKLIKDKALELGFANIGFTRPERLNNEAEFLKNWLSDSMHGDMQWLENHFEKRVHPEKLVPNAKTVIVLLHNYYPGKIQHTQTKYRVSKYAYGRDYHKVIKNKLRILYDFISELYNNHLTGRYFVDSAPVMERPLARNAGLGWIGKNTLLINPKIGSYFFISELIIDQELREVKPPITDHCGRCKACLSACPTGALSPAKPYVLNASLCISYHTIELSKPNKLPLAGNSKWIFGCDICQDVCPWNNKAVISTEPDFAIKPFIADATDQDWENLTKDQFDEYFNGTPVKRAGFEGMKQNIELIKNT